MNPSINQSNEISEGIAAFIKANESEVNMRYNQLLPEINAAAGKGILSIHNKHFGSKGLYFGAAVQQLYKINQGQPIQTEALESNPHPEIQTIIGPVQQKTAHASTTQPHLTVAEADDNDASDFIARHAS